MNPGGPDTQPQQSLIQRLLPQYGGVPQEDRRELTLQEASQIVILQAYLIEELAVELKELRKDLDETKQTLTPSNIHIGKNLFSVEGWRALKTSQDVRDAQSFFTSYFTKILNVPANRTVMESLMALMSLAVRTPTMFDDLSFISGARGLLTELMVAREKANGWQQQQLEALRASMLGSALPAEVSAAYDHARLQVKMAAPVQQHQQNKGGRFQKKHKAENADK